MVMRMQEPMRDLAARFLEQVLVQFCDVRVFVTLTDLFLGVDRVEGLGPPAIEVVVDGIDAVRRIGLAAAADAAAGTGHDLDDVVLGGPPLDVLQDHARVAQA